MLPGQASAGCVGSGHGLWQRPQRRRQRRGVGLAGLHRGAGCPRRRAAGIKHTNHMPIPPLRAQHRAWMMPIVRGTAQGLLSIIDTPNDQHLQHCRVWRAASQSCWLPTSAAAASSSLSAGTAMGLQQAALVAPRPGTCWKRLASRCSSLCSCGSSTKRPSQVRPNPELHIPRICHYLWM